MSRLVPVAVIVAAMLVAQPAAALAQWPAPERVLTGASAATGRVHGLVRDPAGAAIAGAHVLAVGRTTLMARTDAGGRFQLALPPGDYVLRAARAGYVSSYREAVSVRSRASIERTITLMWQTATAADPPADAHAHSELAWRLRHLPRSVLRDGSSGAPDDAQSRMPASLWDRTVDASLRLASRVAHADFTGQVNFLATASGLPGLPPTSAPRSVAFVAIGAPAGHHADWRVRGAIASGPDASWNVLGEYVHHGSSGHRSTLGVSFSAQDARAPALGRFSRALAESRSVVGLSVQSDWRAFDRLHVEYALRADRYGYLASPHLWSASGRARAQVLAATTVTVGAGRLMVAPGADEFLPPPGQGPWLPPERTFSALGRREILRAQTVRHADIGLTQSLASGPLQPALEVRAFWQGVDRQMATLFGAGHQARRGHYHVATAGDAALAGWAVALTSDASQRLRTRVEYARYRAAWDPVRHPWGLCAVAPGVIREDEAWIAELTAAVDASLRDDTTRLSVLYRTSSAYSTDQRELPLRGGRFDLELHQALPYRPSRNTRLELLFAARTLFREPNHAASLFDELLTVGPPLRVMAGIQVRF